MNHLTRRQYLKRSAILIAGAATVPYGIDLAKGPNKSAQHASDARSLYEQGSVPVSESGWTKPEGEGVQYPVLTGEVRVDVAVVGAGLAGSSVTLHLAEAGVTTALLDARQPGWGASGRNAGHVMPTLRDRNALKRFPDQGQAFLEQFREHHNIVYDIARTYNIACDAAQTGYLDACLSQSSFETYQELSRYWSEQHGQYVEFLGREEMQALVGSSYYPYGVYYHSGGRINPYRFTNGMVTAAVALGARVFGDSEVSALTKVGDQWRINSAEGAVIADRVIFCTNAYPTAVIPEVTNNFYPLTAYAMSFKPLPTELHEHILPGRPAFAQMPVDLNPMVIDEHHRIILSSLPSASGAGDWPTYLKNHQRWLQRTWPQLKGYNLEMESYWTGRVALRDEEFPGVFKLRDGVYGLMHFNAWGNTMAPLMGKLMAGAIATDDWSRMPCPLQHPEPVGNPNKKHFIIRSVMIPAARLGQRMGFI